MKECKIISFKDYNKNKEIELLREFRTLSDHLINEINLIEYVENKRHEKITQLILDKYK